MQAFENGDTDDMDNLAWSGFIDEYHCIDYWISTDEWEYEDSFADEFDDGEADPSGAD